MTHQKMLQKKTEGHRRPCQEKRQGVKGASCLELAITESMIC